MGRFVNEDRSRLVAYIKMNKDARLDAEQLRRSLAGQLPEYMIPSQFISVVSLPRLANGKVDRNRLRQSVPIEHAPEHDNRLRPQTESMDTDGLEARLSALWARNLNTDYVLPDDDFFDLGGHSLLGVQLLLDVKEEFDTEIPLADLFEASRLRDMVLRIRRPESGPRVVATIQSGTDETPIFAVHGGDKTLAAAFGPDRPLYLVFDSISTSTADMSSVERIAQHYLKGIREIQPHGPYILCGYSLGGMIAYEMALLLTREGEAVNLVTLVDSTPPHIGRWGLGIRAYHLLSRLVDQRGLLNKTDYLLRTITNKLRRKLRAAMMSSVTVPQGHAEIRKANMARYFEVGFQYRYPVSTLNCLVYMPDHHPLWVKHLSRKWRRVMRGQLAIECVEGAREHMDMTRPPYDARSAQSFADRVRALETAARDASVQEQPAGRRPQ
ncbi:MAG: hypothetical protein KJO95_12200 [Gammaproteobacteria bacterium]|nr:hypothetical protein [Gammaproteobacteria bacterium]NNC58211.1 hypothetical protein [Woeseiaceae bacterium]